MKRRRSGRIQRAAACFLAAAVLTAAGAGNALAEEERAECVKEESVEKAGSAAVQEKTEPIGTAQPAAVESAPSAAENPTPEGTEGSGTEADGAGETGTEGKAPGAEGNAAGGSEERNPEGQEPGGSGQDDAEEPGTEEPGKDDAEEPGTEEPGKDDAEEPGTEEPGTDDPEEPETEEPGQDDAEEPETEEPGQGGADLPGMDIVIPVAIPLSSGAEYDQLSTFLSLSSDRFAVYTVVFVNLAQQPVQPEDPVEITLDIPADYDMSRVAVSEISVEGETPVRTELDFEAVGGKAVFSTDHMGIYVVMEKTVYPELPQKLELTAKVEKLELPAAIPAALAMTSLYGSGSLTSVPLTGDSGVPVQLWIVIMILAAAAAAAVIIINNRRKK